MLFEPYTFAGLGWQHFNLASAIGGTATADINNNDDIMTVPMGVGVAFGFSGLTLDVRGTYRQAYFSNTFGRPSTSFDSESLNSWGAGAALGFEF